VGELSLWVNVVPEITDPVHEVLGVEFDQLLVMHHFDQIMQADLLRLYRFAFAWGETLGPRLPFAFFQDRQQQPFHEAANADDRKGVGAIALADTGLLKAVEEYFRRFLVLDERPKTLFQVRGLRHVDSAARSQPPHYGPSAGLADGQPLGP